MTATLLYAALRHLARRPGESALAVLGIALGVAVVVSVDLVGESARRALALSADAVVGRATHQITGGPAGLDEDLYRRLRVDAGVRLAAPVVEGHVRVPGFSGRAFQLLGVDALAEAPFRPYLRPGTVAAAQDLAALLVAPGAVVVSAPVARELGLAQGSLLRTEVDGRTHDLRVVGQVNGANAASSAALDTLLLADVATAQEVLGRIGRLSRIDLAIPDGPAGARVLARVRAALPPGASVTRSESRGAFVEQVTRAFTANLTALSLLALLVGMFLIYNTMTFSVVRRRTAIGRLRALGVTRAQVVTLVLAEAAAVGLVATTLGLGLGVGLAQGLLRLVTRAINDLYFVVAVRDVTVAPLGLAKGALLGLGATLAASLAPALEASAAPPAAVWTRASLETRHRRAPARVAVLGLLVLAAGAALFRLGGDGLAAGYAGLLAVVLGAALLTPAATVGLLRVAAPPARRLGGALGALAVRGVSASLSRTGIAVAALMVAVAATVGIGVMIASFRETVVRWLSSGLVDDVYVSPPSLVGSRGDATLPPDVVARIRATPDVLAVHTSREVEIGPPDTPTRLLALGLDRQGFRQFRFVEPPAGGSAAVWAAFEGGGAAIVSEALAYRRGLGTGGTLRLLTDRGPHEFPIVGVFADFRSDQGLAAVSRRTYDAFWDDAGVSSLGLVAAPGADLRALMADVRARAGVQHDLMVRDTRTLLRASIDVFDRTFVVTGVLRLLATAVAIVGILSALMALQLERARELALLRAQGLTPGQLWAVVTAQTGLMGLCAGLVAVPVGVVEALVLVGVLNRRAFGWSLELHVDAETLLRALLLAVASALLAGVWPALRMARTPPAAGLREE